MLFCDCHLQAFLYRLECKLFHTAERTASYPPACLIPPHLQDYDAVTSTFVGWCRVASFNSLKSCEQLLKTLDRSQLQCAALPSHTSFLTSL